MSPEQRAISNIKRWTRDPISFVRDQFGVEPDAWQAEVLKAFPSQQENMKRISMQACAGPGKTAVLAWCGWNFLTCYAAPGQHPKGAVVSVTYDSLRDALWPEFAKWQERSELLKRAFQWTKERISSREHPETWFLSARSFSKAANVDEQGRTLSGLHSDYILALIDESGEIPPGVLRAAEQALSSCKWGKIVQAGNPTSHDGMLYAAATRLREQWKIIRITGDPDDPNRSPRIDPVWAQEQINIYGRDNPWVQSYILGTFPSSSLNSLLSLEDVEAAMQREPPYDQYAFAQKRLGVDVARYGLDSTVIFPRMGLMAYKPVVLRNASTTEIAARVALARSKWGSELEFLDDTGGWAAGVVDSLIQAGMSPQPVNFSGKASNDRYFNKRSEMHFALSDWVRRGGALPNDPRLVKELTAPTYFFQNGKFRLEEKEQIRKRLGFSPDLADALALTFALPDQPGRNFRGFPSHHEQRRATHDYDPYDPSRTGGMQF